MEDCQRMAGFWAACVSRYASEVTRLRQPVDLNLWRVAALLFTGPVEPFERLASGEEQVLLGGLTRLVVGRGASVRACCRKPGAHRRGLAGADEVAAHAHRVLFIRREDAQARQAADQVEAIEDAIVLT